MRDERNVMSTQPFLQRSHLRLQQRRNRASNPPLCTLPPVSGAWCFPEGTSQDSSLPGELICWVLVQIFTFWWLNQLIKVLLLFIHVVFCGKTSGYPLCFSLIYSDLVSCCCLKARHIWTVGLLSDGCSFCAALSRFECSTRSQCAGSLCSSGRQDLDFTSDPVSR